MQKLFVFLATLAVISTHHLESDFKLPQMTPPTPHINAPAGSFGKTVLVPGDPKRAKYIAEKFFENPKLVNDVRGVQGYTGTYKGIKISVQASGMGIPSMGIYSYELFNAYGVENILRVGSAGSIHPNIGLHDVVVATGASTNSNYGKNFDLPGTISAIASYKVVSKCEEAIANLGLESRTAFGQILSSDTFYTDVPESDKRWAKMGILAVEMEAYGLYLNAARSGKNALAITTISDDLLKNEHLTAEERQLSFDEMITIALETAVLLEEE